MVWRPGWLKNEPVDMKLFEEQVHPIYKDLFRYIYSIVRNSALAEDTLQNTLEKAYKSMASFEGRSKFKTWIYTIARNESITLLRKYRRENLTGGLQLDMLCSGEQLLPEEHIINAELRDQVVETINRLRPEYRDLIILRYYGGLSIEEISIALNVKINTVKTWHMRAKEKIAQELKEHYFFKDECQANPVKGGEADA